MEEGREVTLRLEHPRAIVALLFCAVLTLGALLEYDNRVLEENIVALRYCLQVGGAKPVAFQQEMAWWWASPAKPDPFPTVLRVNGEPWRLLHRQPPNGFGRLRGLTLCKQKVVYVSPDLEERDTLLHELLHISFGCAVDDAAWDELRYTEEDAILRMTPNLLRLLRENPEIAAYLGGR